MNNGLYWFEHDLRLADNLPLRQTVAQVDQLHCIYIFNPANFSPKVKKGADLFNRRYMGQHRYRFIRQAIDDLQAQLHTFGQQLHIYYGEPLDIIEQLNTQFNFTHIGKHFHTGVYERNTVSLLRTQYPDKSIINTNSYTLYDIDDLPMSIDNLPDVFSPFRRKVEKFCEARLPDNALPASFPPVLVADQITPDELPTIQVCDKKLFAKNETVQRLIGGELKAKEQMHYYTYGTQALSEYKETRNGLEGWDFSSKLSPWLAAGCISPRQVAAAITEYETQHGANDSTYWLFFELLWREFFQWQQLKHGKSLYHRNGIQQKSPRGFHNKKVFEDWVNGDTAYPIINACMRQLKYTGFMSNRGRQLVASCFIHELGLDWQYGAAYFEETLIDFDPASNWGNWQYLAGVGSDPRGCRQFNLNKQTQTYDPHGEFIEYWADYAPSN